ncbi:MAG: hypothetical protein VX619_12055 [bacterium]|nr:hypothetical protein [bacterium]
MRFLFISISLLSLWILPSKATADTVLVESKEQSQSGSQITNKLISLLKKCQNLNRKITPKRTLNNDIPSSRQVPKFLTRKSELSIISGKKELPREALPSNSKKISIRTKKSVKSKKSSWSFLDLFSQLHGPAPFARR